MPTSVPVYVVSWRERKRARAFATNSCWCWFLSHSLSPLVSFIQIRMWVSKSHNKTSPSPVSSLIPHLVDIFKFRETERERTTKSQVSQKFLSLLSNLEREIILLRNGWKRRREIIKSHKNTWLSYLRKSRHCRLLVQAPLHSMYHVSSASVCERGREI